MEKLDRKCEHPAILNVRCSGIPLKYSRLRADMGTLLYTYISTVHVIYKSWNSSAIGYCSRQAKATEVYHHLPLCDGVKLYARCYKL